MTYRGDLARGQVAERLTLRLLEGAGLKGRQNRAKNRAKDRARLAEWDIEASLDGRRFTLECKFDLFEARSGNVAIEYYNPRAARPSGILATKADLWVHVLTDPETVWVCRVADLRRYWKEVKCLRDIPCGGDGNAAMKLYPREEIFGAIFRRADDLDADALLTLLRELLKEKRP